MNFLKRIASYLYPIKIHQTSSERSGSLEVTLINGKLVMDSDNANYSYGSLQKVLKKGLLQFDIAKLKQCKNILVLGVAGGSILETLQDDFKLTEAKITGVEIDAEVLELAKIYFQIDQKKNVNLVLADAFKFINTTKETYDLIVIDIFNDSNMPPQLFEKSYWINICNLLNLKGLCLFNSIIDSSGDKQRNENLQFLLKDIFSVVKQKTTHINELFVLEK